MDDELEVIVPASSPSMVYCFDGETGDVEWSISTGANHIDSPPAIGTLLVSMEKNESNTIDIINHTNSGELLADFSIPTTSYFVLTFH